VSKIKFLRLTLCAVIFSLGLVSQALATPIAVNFTSDTAPPEAFGGGSFSLSGDSGTLALDTELPTVNIVNVAKFAGDNNICAAPCIGGGNGAFYYILELDNVSNFVTQPFSVVANSFIGELQTSASTSPTLFHTAAGSWDVTLNPFAIGFFTGSDKEESVTATFTPVPDTPAATPEPTSVLLFATAMLAMAFLLRKSLLT